MTSSVGCLIHEVPCASIFMFVRILTSILCLCWEGEIEDRHVGYVLHFFQIHLFIWLFVVHEFILVLAMQALLTLYSNFGLILKSSKVYCMPVYPVWVICRVQYPSFFS